MNKKPWLSKTLWANFIVAGIAFFPGADNYYHAHPLVVVEFLAIANVVLRLATHDRLSLADA